MSKPTLTDILTNEHFQSIAAVIRGARYSDAHAPIEDAYAALVKATRPYKPDEWLDKFSDLQLKIGEQFPDMRPTNEDIVGLVRGLDGERPETTMAMLFAYASAPEERMTPAEIAAATGTAESGWRNKAAAGELPGSIKKGKLWLIPKRYAAARSNGSQRQDVISDPASPTGLWLAKWDGTDWVPQTDADGMRIPAKPK